LFDVEGGTGPVLFEIKPAAAAPRDVRKKGKKGNKVVGALRQEPDFCIKVVHDDDKFKRELSAVMAVKDRFNRQRKKQDGPWFYILNCQRVISKLFQMRHLSEIQ
jgi:hypothetical protein